VSWELLGVEKRCVRFSHLLFHSFSLPLLSFFSPSFFLLSILSLLSSPSSPSSSLPLLPSSSSPSSP
jgi:hypothetical protein